MQLLKYILEDTLKEMREKHFRERNCGLHATRAEITKTRKELSIAKERQEKLRPEHLIASMTDEYFVVAKIYQNQEEVYERVTRLEHTLDRLEAEGLRLEQLVFQELSIRDQFRF